MELNLLQKVTVELKPGQELQGRVVGTAKKDGKLFRVDIETAKGLISLSINPNTE